MQIPYSIVIVPDGAHGNCSVVLFVEDDRPVYSQVLAAFPCERFVDSGFASGIAVADDLPVYFQADVASCEY